MQLNEFRIGNEIVFLLKKIYKFFSVINGGFFNDGYELCLTECGNNNNNNLKNCSNKPETCTNNFPETNGNK